MIADAPEHHIDAVAVFSFKNTFEFAHYFALARVVAAKQLMRDYFDSWTRISGLYGYINHCAFTADMLDCDQNKIRELKNLFSCEAHNELIEKSTKVIYDGRIEEVKKYEAKIRTLQNMEIPEE